MMKEFDPYDEYRVPPQGCGSAIAGGIALVVIAILLCLSGCKTQVVTQTEYKERTVEVRVRDTVITTAADSASIRALFRCDSAYNVVIDELTTLQGNRIKADVTTKPTTKGTTKGLQIEFECKEDSMAIVCHMKDSIISDLSQQVQVLSVPRPRTAYDRFCSGFFWVVVLLIVLKVAVWVLSKYPVTAPYIAVLRRFIPFL